MENLLLLLATSFVYRLAQPSGHKIQPIANTGCSALLPLRNAGFDRSVTDSGDTLYFNDWTENNVTYGMICVRLSEPIELAKAGYMLYQYVEDLRHPCAVDVHAGIQATKDWNSSVTETVVDYWQDAHGQDWKVKGYTDGHTLAVLYVKNIGEVDVQRQDQFLDGFHFGA